MRPLKCMSMPSKDDCFFYLEMAESGLIDFSYIHPWADSIIKSMDNIPRWLFDLSTKKAQGDLIRAFRGYVFSEPFEAVPTELEKFHVACLWLRYSRRELSWASALKKMGEFLDAANGEWLCEVPYHYLNIHEDKQFSRESERSIKSSLLVELDIMPWIQLAEEKLSVFTQFEKVSK